MLNGTGGQAPCPILFLGAQVKKFKKQIKCGWNKNFPALL
ncbi:hypothetical protein SAMN04490355_1008123 [Pelosinus propionicus DSM 13327]|uniref:Uncharacterized protein n=1 Tax=Pelosinus propionicus DSM 13327 TaxID=1123291 RepID=A0A1I4IKJ1_9FIRM|nr:hypothetical protein SAMN04490355_1008123 [Pelosinus propionicus DSM 13327]